MADLHFVDFAVIPNPVRKEKQFRLPDDLFDLLSVTAQPFRVRFSRAFSSFHVAGRVLFGDPQNVLHDEDEVEAGKIFQQQVEIVAY